MTVIETECAHSGRADGCVGEPDTQFDSAIDSARWCSHCEPLMLARRAIIERLLDAGFGPQLQAAYETVDAEIQAGRS